jgi:hypothetical protein
MSHPFDATLKELLEAGAADFVPAFGLPTDLPAVTLNVDLSTLSAATDVALGFGDPIRRVADLNFQSGPDPRLEARLLLYNAALHHRFAAPVRSLLILLRPAADHTRLTGRYAYTDGGGRVEFEYEVVRLWQRPVEPFLGGGLGLLPLAPLCELPPGVPVAEALGNVVRLVEQRLLQLADRAAAVRLMTAAYILTGLRVDRDTLNVVYQGVRIMHESSAYQAILDEGQLKRARHDLLHLGRIRFGQPDAATEAVLADLNDLERLDRMIEAVLTAEGWPQLLATP